MIRLEAIVENRHDNTFSGDAFSPRWDDVHVVSTATILRKSRRKWSLLQARDSAFYTQHSMMLEDWMIKATCSRIKSHITCTFCFPMETNRARAWVRMKRWQWQGKARRRETRRKRVLNKIWVNLRVEKLNKEQEPYVFCSINSRCLLGWNCR